MRPAQAGVAIILRTRPYRESDKLVTFLSRDFGKLTGIAMGAKNSRRRFANCLDPLTRVRVYFRTRPSSSLAFMESCDLLHPASAFAEPVKLAYASYLIELTDQLTAEAQTVPELYDLLDAALTALEHGPATAAFLRAFELHLLQLAGYEPHFETCAGCRVDLTGHDPVFLDGAHGRLLCQACQTGRRDLVEVSGSVIALLERLKEIRLSEAQAHRLPPALADAAARIAGHLLALHLPRPLRSVGLIANLTPPRE
jgi:DNA repair protein RecO (recombination protein O)